VQRPRPTRNRGVGLLLLLPQKILTYPQVRPFAGGDARTALPQYLWMFPHPCPNCKQGARKAGPKTPQRASFSDSSSQERSHEGRLIATGSGGPRASPKAANRNPPRRPLLSRRRVRASSSQPIFASFRLAPPSRPRGGSASTSQGYPRTVFCRALERRNRFVRGARIEFESVRRPSRAGMRSL
jgi:hypothetical protein